MRLSRLAHRQGVVLSCAAALLFGACSTRAPRPQSLPEPPPLADTQARQLVDAWQQRLTQYVADAGQGDPAVLARLPAQRATGTLRPARISFGVLDLEARVAEADGFDVQGLLLSPPPQGGATGYVFMVGIVRREGYRPVALADLRPVTLQMQGGRLQARIGDADAQALARYRAAIDASVPLRFPADKDDFTLAPCAEDLCVDERSAGARWRITR